VTSRTGTLPDYVENDSANYGPLPEQYQVDQLLSWYSKDQVINENGKELVDLCISANLHISKWMSISDTIFHMLHTEETV